MAVCDDCVAALLASSALNGFTLVATVEEALVFCAGVMGRKAPSVQVDPLGHAEHDVLPAMAEYELRAHR